MKTRNRFSAVAIFAAVLAVFAASMAVGEDTAPAATIKADPVESRPFYMGLLLWSLGSTPEDLQKTRELIGKHSDMLSMQFNDGIPWPEAYEGKPYNQKLEELIQERLKNLNPKQKLYIEIASLNMDRSDYAQYYGAAGHMPLPEPWKTYAVDSEQKITAYANFCNDIAARFKPDFMNYGLESADLAHRKPDQWDAFVRFHAEVYKRIKEKHPNLPLCISVPLKLPGSEAAKKLGEEVPKILPYVDFLAATVYPFVMFGHKDAGNPANLPENWLSQIVEYAHGKPVAVSESQWAVENIDVQAWNIHIKTNPEWQRDYMEKLLPEAKKINAKFLVWWPIVDWDKLWQTFPDNVKDLGRLFRDTGLYDEKLQPRPALSVWDAWLASPVAR